jgi:hypothetical protein
LSRDGFAEVWLAEMLVKAARSKARILKAPVSYLVIG